MVLFDFGGIITGLFQGGVFADPHIIPGRIIGGTAHDNRDLKPLFAQLLGPLAGIFMNLECPDLYRERRFTIGGDFGLVILCC